MKNISAYFYLYAYIRTEVKISTHISQISTNFKIIIRFLYTHNFLVTVNYLIKYDYMGYMRGKVMGKAFIVLDAFPLPVEGTETRVNAGQEAIEYTGA